MGGTIFICYRRDEDAAAAGQLYDYLERTFGQQQLFFDVDNIPAGEDFVGVLDAHVAACDVLLAVIGRGWLTATDKTGHRRLDNPDDFVRIEIASGLAQGKRVIPVLVDDARMPGANELPQELVPLARRQAVRITYDRFRDDAERLVRVLKRALATPRKADEGDQSAEALHMAEEQDCQERKATQLGPQKPQGEPKWQAEEDEQRRHQPKAETSIRAGEEHESRIKLPKTLAGFIKLMLGIVAVVVFVGTLYSISDTLFGTTEPPDTPKPSDKMEPPDTPKPPDTAEPADTTEPPDTAKPAEPPDTAKPPDTGAC